MAKKPDKPRLPKKECCLDRPRCKRCPIRALAEGTMPPGYTVKRRRLVRIEEPDAGGGIALVAAADAGKSGKKKKDKAGKQSGKGRKKRDGAERAA